MIESCADRYGWAAGARREALNGLFWSKLSAAGRCWCGGTLLHYKLSETIHSHPSSVGSKSPDSITAETQQGEPEEAGEARLIVPHVTFLSTKYKPEMFSHCRSEMKGSSASCRRNPIHESITRQSEE